MSFTPEICDLCQREVEHRDDLITIKVPNAVDPTMPTNKSVCVICLAKLNAFNAMARR